MQRISPLLLRLNPDDSGSINPISEKKENPLFYFEVAFLNYSNTY